jgi:hypothetical protein
MEIFGAEMNNPDAVNMEEILTIIKAYAYQGADHVRLAELYGILLASRTHVKDLTTKEKEEDKRIETKILSIISGKEEKNKNITDNLRAYIDYTDGIFSLQDCYGAIGAVDVKEKANIRKALCVMCKGKEIEKIGTRSGIYRKPNRDYEVIDLDGAVPDPLNVELPLRIDQLCNVYNGMTILAEGEKSTGKSAFGIETAWLNRKLFPGKVRYMQNGELNKQMLTIRLMLRPQETYPIKKFSESIEFITRHRDWWDIVNPEGLNIIDYIEEHEKKYLIPDYIARIQERLTTGIALIILQRVPGRDYGTGGAEIRNKPSVIVALKRQGKINSVHIEDIKSYNQQNIGTLFGDEVTNPRGLWREYNLIDGWKFYAKGKWRSPDDKKEYDYFRGGKDEQFVHEN